MRRSAGPGRDDAGFTLIELLVVMVILPLVVGAASVAVITIMRNTVSTDPNGTAVRLADSHDTQITSAYMVRDVQSAEWITTNPTPVCAPAGYPYRTQLLGARWHEGSSTYSVSYLIAEFPAPELTRYYCQDASWLPTATSSTAVQSVSVISHDVFSHTNTNTTFQPGDVAVGRCPASGFGSGASSCAGVPAAEAGAIDPAYVASTVTCSDGSVGCSGSGLTPVVPTTPGGVGITRAQIAVYDNAVAGYQYKLTGVSRLTNLEQQNPARYPPPPGPLNPAFLSNGPVTLGNCSELVEGTAAINDNSPDWVTTKAQGNLTAASIFSTYPGAASSSANLSTRPSTTSPVPSPYDFLVEPPSMPSGVRVVQMTSGGTIKGTLSQPTEYVVSNGDLDISDFTAADGSGVLIYVKSGVSRITFSGQNALTPITPNWEQTDPAAPHPPLPEVVVWVSQSDGSHADPPQIIMNGNGGATTLQGAVYAPTAQVTLSGGGRSGGIKTQKLDIGSLTKCSGGGSQRAHGGYDFVAGSPLNAAVAMAVQNPSITTGQGEQVTVSVVGVGSLTPQGTVDVYECGPVATPPIGCSSTANQVGSALPLPSTTTGTAQVATSFTAPAAGTYCFSAAYSGQTTNGGDITVYNSQSDTSSDGCFTVSGPPAPSVSSPASSSCFSSQALAGCRSPWPSAAPIAGAATDPGGPGLAAIQVAIQDPRGMWWSGTGSSFGSNVPVVQTATDKSGNGSFSSWEYDGFTASDFPAGDTGSYTVVVSSQDKSGATSLTVQRTFLWKG